MKRIGVLTGGGDAPGLNAVIRAVVKTAHGEYGSEVIVIKDGFDGLLDQHGIEQLNSESVRGILPRGATCALRAYRTSDNVPTSDSALAHRCRSPYNDQTGSKPR